MYRQQLQAQFHHGYHHGYPPHAIPPYWVYPPYWFYPYWPWPPYHHYPYRNDNQGERDPIAIKDYGPNPYVVNIEKATEQNDTFRTALWTGNHLQLTLMSIPVGEDIGLERHSTTDQFLRVEDGQGIVKMGSARDQLDFQRPVHDDDVILIPAGTWHNVINTGNEPLKLYSLYAPPEHPHGTIHRTKAEAIAAEHHH